MGLLSVLPMPHAGFFPSHSFNPNILNCLEHLPTSYGLTALKEWYISADPLHPALLFCAFSSLMVWIVGELTGNVSQVDRLWTFLPMIYNIHFTMYPKWSGRGELDSRMLLLLGLKTLWSARLTTNTYRRGFFNPYEEDYRWEIVRQRIPTWQFKIMNFTFIAIMQNWLLLAAELPQYLLLTLTPIFSSTYRMPAINYIDYALVALFVTVIALEMLADNQQQIYQSFKAKAIKAEKSGKGKKLSIKDQGRLTRGFVTEGLWSFSRHPNFACEQSTWWVIYMFTLFPLLPSSFTLTGLFQTITSISSTADLLQFGKDLQGLLWNYSIWSPITMTMLFYSSTALTEEISAAKYPLYAQYQRRVAEFWVPITTLKGFWLTLTGEKAEVDDLVFGSASKAAKKKM